MVNQRQRTPKQSGMKLARELLRAGLESTLIMAMMSQRFVYDPVPDHPVEPEATLTLRPRYGVKMIARRRAEGPY